MPRRLDLIEPTGSIADSAGNFFRSRRANMIVGRLTGALQYTSYSAWNKSHNIQHHINHGKDVRTSALNTFFALCLICSACLNPQSLNLSCDKVEKKPRSTRSEESSLRYAAALHLVLILGKACTAMNYSSIHRRMSCDDAGGHWLCRIMFLWT